MLRPGGEGALGFQSNEPEEGQRAFPGGAGAPLWEAGRGHKFDPWLGNLCSCVLHVQPKKNPGQQHISDLLDEVATVLPPFHQGIKE